MAVTGAQGTCLLVGSCETQASPVVKIVPEFLLDGDLQMTFEGAFIKLFIRAAPLANPRARLVRVFRLRQARWSQSKRGRPREPM